MILNNVLVICTAFGVLFVLFNKRVRLSQTWRATVTPLASIIGSGFLISGPLYILSAGVYAPLAMAGIVTIGYFLGSSIRFNIKESEPLLANGLTSNKTVEYLEELSRGMLAVAYVISITFYLKLLSVFFLRGFYLSTPILQNTLTTGLLLFIGVTGKLKGLSLLESIETYSVNIKLSIIIALLIGHMSFNYDLFSAGHWEIKVYPHGDSITAIRKILGSLIIIQGFETSRYLGKSYTAAIRIKTMRNAQLIAGAIYVIFISTTLTLFNDIHNVNETTVIDICRIIAPVLPWMLIVAAVMSQFSAAVADTIGSGGLIVEAFTNKISLNTSYFIIAVIGIALTWLTNIYSIIVFASKAFAIYYALQLIISIVLLKRKRRAQTIGCFLLVAVMVLVIFWGIPVQE